MRHKIPLVLALLLTLGIRCAHLTFNHYRIVNPDSHYFRILSKQDSVSWFQNGLAPVLKYTATWGEFLIPPALAVVTALILYWFCTKVFSKDVGLLTVAIYALFQPAALMGASGNLDADLLTTLFVLIACVTYFFSRTWIGAMFIGATSLAIYAEWSWVGVAVVAVILVASIVAEYLQSKKLERPQVVLALGGMAAIIVPFLIPHFLANLRWLSNSPNVAEMSPVNLILLFPYWCFLLFPLAFGLRFLYNHRQAQETATEYQTVQALTFLSAWIAACLLMGLAAYRLTQFMLPAACIMAGFGFSVILKDKILAPDKKKAVIMCSVIMLLLSGTFAIDLPENMVMPNTWVDACKWMKEETPESSKMLTWWDNGYPIQDVAERDTVTDGGHAGDTNTHHFIGLVYCTDNDRYATQIMQEYGAQYVVFSTIERNYFKTIEKMAGQSGANGLYERSISEEFESPYFTKVYQNDVVWILKATCATCGG